MKSKMKDIMNLLIKKEKQILFVIVSIFWSIFFLMHINQSLFLFDTLKLFDRELASGEEVERYELASGESLQQYFVVGEEGDILGGISIPFYVNESRIESGENGKLTLALYQLVETEEGVDTSEIEIIERDINTLNEKTKILLSHPLKLEKDMEYGLIMMASYDGDPGLLEVGMAKPFDWETEIYASGVDMEKEELECGLLLTNKSHNTIIIGFFLFLFAIITIAVLCNLDERIIMIALLTTMSIVYLLFTPAGNAPDELNHFKRAFEVSCGHMVSEHIENNAGGRVLPNALSEYGNSNARLDWDDVSMQEFSNISVYPPSSYIPQSLGVFLARLFTDKVRAILYTGVVFNMVFILLIAGITLWIIPFGRRVAFLGLLFPMTLQEITSLAPDGQLIAVCFLFMAIIMKLGYEKKASKAELFLLAFIAMWIGTVKLVYVPLLLLLFFVPTELFKSKKNWLYYIIGIIGFTAVADLGWLAIANYSFPEGIDSALQIEYILQHPVAYIGTLIRSVDAYGGEWLETMIGSRLGKLDVPVCKVVYDGFLIILICEIMSAKDKKLPQGVNRRVALWLSIVSLVGTMVLILTGIYVKCVGIGEKLIWGLQGRYLTPLIMFMAVMIALESRNDSTQEVNTNEAMINAKGKMSSIKDWSDTYLYLIVAILDAIAFVDILVYYR